MNIETDFCKYVDIFYGNGEVDHFVEEGLASKWFYIKALCGNTIPHAVSPFGKMSVGAYSGGYPTGYGTHYPNSCGGIQKMGDELKIRGFSHLHQSGTGGIAYYYNYAITIPFYGSVSNITKYYKVNRECGRPGYYSTEFNHIFCELTVNGNTAVHRYRFAKDAGRVAVDFSNDGLSKLFSDRYYSFVKEGKAELASSDEVLFSGVFSGVKLFFCVTAEGQGVQGGLFSNKMELEEPHLSVQDNTLPFGAVFDFQGSEIIVKVSYSTIGYKQARENILATKGSFEKIVDQAHRVWNRYLSAIEIQTEDEELKEKFYSNYYHSIVKPCDMAGEEALGIKGDLVTDLATLWDQYKTLYPLIFMLYPQMSEKLVKAIGNISRTLGRIPCSLGLTEIFSCEQQAKMLGILALCDAYHCGVKAADKELITECIQRELARDDFKIFLKSGFFERYTHIIDTTDACLAVAEITDDIELKSRLLKLAENWVNAYDEDGLMSEKSPYYEGDRYTYSFRLQKNMDERIALAGGKERFVKLLDDFFGYNGESLKQLIHLGADSEIAETRHHRFEGFNNECDMETPYAYIYAGRHERTCDIVRESVAKSYTLGKGALPGNNDSGGLSSCFLWNVLGIFPASGTGEFLVGFPQIDKAIIRLAGGNKLEIEVEKQIGECNSVNMVEFNGQKITDYRVSTQSLIKGGKLKVQVIWKK